MINLKCDLYFLDTEGYEKIIDIENDYASIIDVGDIVDDGMEELIVTRKWINVSENTIRFQCDLFDD
jgi:hypothetical protein